MRRLVPFVSALLMLAGIFATPAAADDQSVCFNTTTAPDTAIEACGRMISSGLRARQGVRVARPCLPEQGRPRPRHRRLQRGDPARSEIRLAYNNRGLAYGNKGDYDRAIADFNEAIRLDPKLRHRLQQPRRRVPQQGRLRPRHRRLQRGDPARSEQRHPPTTIAATPMHAKGDYDRAIADYNEAIRLNPKYALAYTNRGNAWRQQGRLRPRHRRLQRGDPAQSEIRATPTTTAARVLARQGRLSTAPSPTTTRRSGSIRTYALTPTTTAATPGTPRATTTAPSPTTARRSGSIRNTPPPTPTAATPGIDQGRLRPRHRRLQRGDPARSEIRRRLQQPRRAYSRQGRLRPRHRRLQRGDPAQSEHTPTPTTTAASPSTPRATTTAPSPTTARRSGSIRNTPSPTTTAATPTRQGRLRPRHRRLQRGDPARSEGRGRLRQPRRRLSTARATTTAPSPTSTRRSGSIRKTPSPTTTAASPTAPRATTTAPSPTSTEAIRLDPKSRVAYSNRGLRLQQQGRLRPRHRRLHRGDPARSERCHALRQPRPRLRIERRLRQRPCRFSVRPRARTEPTNTLAKPSAAWSRSSRRGPSRSRRSPLRPILPRTKSFAALARTLTTESPPAHGKSIRAG